MSEWVEEEAQQGGGGKACKGRGCSSLGSGQEWGLMEPTHLEWPGLGAGAELAVLGSGGGCGGGIGAAAGTQAAAGGLRLEGPRGVACTPIVLHTGIMRRSSRRRDSHISSGGCACDEDGKG